jgi:hypothetical protein
MTGSLTKNIAMGFPICLFLIHNKDEWEQLPRLQGAFSQGRGGKEEGGRAEKTGS